MIQRIKKTRFFKHYIRPLLRRNQIPDYSFWKRYYSDGIITDQKTVSMAKSLVQIDANYKVLEDAIYSNLHSYMRMVGIRILDYGTGAGHWVRFYRSLFDPSLIITIDKYTFAEYQYIEEVSQRRFDIINAVGVMFHILNDNELKNIIRTMSEILNRDGVIIISGQFGHRTANVQFTKVGKENRYNKRIRSMRWWRRTLADAGLKIDTFIKTKDTSLVRGIENNLIFVKHKFNVND